MTTAHSGEQDVIAAVLAEHVRGDWSDRTYSCGGCRKRFEESTQERWANGTDEERRAIHAELSRHIKPDWTLAEYHAHVAEHLAAALFSPGTPCCDLHNRNCEPPSELCCERCTEGAHPGHRDGTACIAPDLSGNGTPPGQGGDR